MVTRAPTERDLARFAESALHLPRPAKPWTLATAAAGGGTICGTSVQGPGHLGEDTYLPKADQAISPGPQPQPDEKIFVQARLSETHSQHRSRMNLGLAETQWTDQKADEEIRTLDPLLGKEMLYH